MYLYGANGTDCRTLDATYDVQHDTVSAEVTPGTYYVRLHNSGVQGTYITCQALKQFMQNAHIDDRCGRLFMHRKFNRILI